MNELLFSYASTLILPAWVLLIVSPLMPRISQAVASIIVPTVLSVAYAVLIMTNWAGAPGGFDSLANVMELFTVPELALAGWLHYLAFDLFVGAWIVHDAARRGIPHWWVVPCLPVTLVFGPAGFALYLLIRASRGISFIPRMLQRV